MNVQEWGLGVFFSGQQSQPAGQPSHNKVERKGLSNDVNFMKVHSALN